MLAHVLRVNRGIRPYLGLLLIIAGTLPFIFLNLLWNYNHCWDNYLFNLLNRTEGSSFSLKLTWKYILTLLYLLTPPIVYFYFKHQASVKAYLTGGREGVFIGLFVVPFTLFFILSFWVSIGLHWLLSFYPFVFLGMAGVLNITALRKCFYFMLPFTVLHLVAYVVIVVMAPGLFKDNENTYKDVVYGWYGGVDRAYGSYIPNELLTWHILQWGAEHGYRMYDFGGAGEPDEEYGVRDFKAKFGGELVSFGRNTCECAPWLLRLSKLGYRLLRRWL